MHSSTLLLTLSSAAVLTAAQQTAPQGYQWSVLNWGAGCARSGCYYDFTIAGAAVSPYPGFFATCSGNDDGAFVSCDVLGYSGYNVTTAPSVLSLVAPSTGDGAHLQVSLLFDSEEGLSYNITGAADATFNQFVALPEYFEIVPGDPLTV